MGHGNLISAVVALFVSMATPNALADEWSEADVAVKRLDPAVFRELPSNIVAELKKRGCTIPQAILPNEPHNVIRGELAKKGQQDWAVLCSRARVSSVLIFWGGASRCPSEILPREDVHSLQEIDSGKIGYSRVIDAGYVTQAKTDDGSTPPPITHDGLEDIFIEKASTIYYCHEGRWVELVGSD